jgi:hypothetical protein
MADALSTKASTQASVPEGVFQRRLLKPTAQPAGLGEGGQTSTSKLAVPVALHPGDPPRVVCTLEGPEDLGEPDTVCGRTNLNYTGSSAQVLFQGLQRTSNSVIPWPVG